MDQVRLIAPFITRAEEISTADRRMAFYVRLHAWHRGQQALKNVMLVSEIFLYFWFY